MLSCNSTDPSLTRAIICQSSPMQFTVEEVCDFEAYAATTYHGKRLPKEWDPDRRARYQNWARRRNTRASHHRFRERVQQGDEKALATADEIRHKDRERHAKRKAEWEVNPELYQEYRAQSQIREERYRHTDKGKERNQRFEETKERKEYQQLRQRLNKVSLDSKWHTLIASARSRGLVLSLSKDEAIGFWTSACFYCGDKPLFDPEGGSLTTIDRVDNTQGYIFSNVVPACLTCNRIKSNITLDVFQRAVSHIAARNGCPHGTTAPEVFHTTGHSTFRDYLRNKDRRDIPFHLSEAEFDQLQAHDCHYCGKQGPSGIDRLDSNGIYESTNCVPCCTLCNQLKGKLLPEAFVQKCIQITCHVPPHDHIVTTTLSLPTDEEAYKIFRGDCHELIRLLPDNSIDLFYTDPPFGITGKSWDQALRWNELWPEIHRVVKPGGWCVIHCSQRFTFNLYLSNPTNYRCKYVWEKTNIKTGHLNSSYLPMREHEDVLCFNQHPKQGTFNGIQNGANTHPSDMLKFPIVQGDFTRPVELAEVFVNYYSTPGDIVLDICMSSGISGLAALKNGRRFIGFDKSYRHFGIAETVLKKKEAVVPAPHPPAPSPPPRRVDDAGLLPPGVTWNQQRKHYVVKWRYQGEKSSRVFTADEKEKAISFRREMEACPKPPTKRPRRNNTLGLEEICLRKMPKGYYDVVALWDTGEISDKDQRKKKKSVHFRFDPANPRESLEAAVEKRAKALDIPPVVVTDKMCEIAVSLAVHEF